MLYANYVYADKYAWNESGLSGTFSVTAVSGDGQIMFGVIDNKMYYSTTNGVSWLPGAGTFTAFAANEIVTDIAVSDDGMRVLVSTNRGLYLSSSPTTFLCGAEAA